MLLQSAVCIVVASKAFMALSPLLSSSFSLLPSAAATNTATATVALLHGMLLLDQLEKSHSQFVLKFAMRRLVSADKKQLK